jgi:CRISPR system Cascade subunit CasB
MVSQTTRKQVNAKQWNEVRKYVNRKIKMIQDERYKNEKAARLARLRRAIGKEAGSVPDIWELTMDLPDELSAGSYSGPTAPTAAENAVHLALTLYALHAQGESNDSKGNADSAQESAGVQQGSARAHTENDVSIGGAAAHLKAADPDGEKGIKRRFDALATAKSYNEIATHARGMVQLFKAKKVGMDYARFAKDLYLLQFPNSAEGVKRGWGRDFYSTIKSKGEEDENEE